jgi:ribonuclease III
VSQPTRCSDDPSPGALAPEGPGGGAAQSPGGPFDLPALEGHLAHTFRDRELLQTALRHKSFVNEKGAGLQHNERLEFLGDAVLQLAVTQLLMEAGTGFSEGELSLWRSQVVSEASLSQLAAQIELGQFLSLGRGEEQSGGRSKPSLLADAYEAVIGAVYQDTGFEYVLRLLRRLLGPVVERVVHSGAVDFKSALQELLQRRDKSRPRYEVVDACGPDHEKTFTVAVYCRDVLYGTAAGRSKREAEQRAAAVAFARLQEPAAAAPPAAASPLHVGESPSAEPASASVHSGAPR